MKGIGTHHCPSCSLGLQQHTNHVIVSGKVYHVSGDWEPNHVMYPRTKPCYVSAGLQGPDQSLNDGLYIPLAAIRDKLNRLSDFFLRLTGCYCVECGSHYDSMT